MVGLNEVEKIEALKAIYPVDALVLEDVFNVHQRVKIEDKNYVFHVIYDHKGELED